MDELQLTDAQQIYFCDLFTNCDEENSGKVTVNKLTDLIKTGNVQEEVISQIAEICWSQNSNYVNRKQFCSALKLVAAHQANLPVRSDTLSANIDLPLPQFAWTRAKKPNDLIELTATELDAGSTDSEVDSETLSVGRNESPSASSTASDSPTPTNSVQDRSWAVTGIWQGLVSEEQRQLLGTEEESSDRHSSEEDTEVSSNRSPLRLTRSHRLQFVKKRYTLIGPCQPQRTVSTEVWTINPEQREYYTAQFRTLQPDTNALIAGPVARMYFEKSRLPVHELRKIWQLADVTKDGALSLEEFSVAMHLVVLRRNHIELPETLPIQLIPGNETPLSVTPETEPILSPQTKDTAKEWTKFVDSPTNSVSSPGPKPVNFDFQKGAVEKDPKILHPVALRITPEVLSVQNEEDDGSSPKKFQDTVVVSSSSSAAGSNSAIQRPQPKKFSAPGPGAIPPPPPPTCNSGSNVEEAGPVSLPAFPPPKKEKPPPPPPRPFKTHGRSSSLDLNRLNKNLAPPSVPPRVSPNVQHHTKKLINQKSEGDCGSRVGDSEREFANFEQFEKYENVSNGIFPGDQFEAERKKLFAQFSVSENVQDTTDAPKKHGAFEIYRKPTTKSRESPTMAPTQTQEDKAKFELFLKLQDQNSVLLRLCQELSQELAEVKEEKISLKVRLEKQLNGG